MLFIKQPLITRIKVVGCGLPLLGGRGVLYFLEQTYHFRANYAPEPKAPAHSSA